MIRDIVRAVLSFWAIVATVLAAMIIVNECEYQARRKRFAEYDNIIRKNLHETMKRKAG